MLPVNILLYSDIYFSNLSFHIFQHLCSVVQTKNPALTKGQSIISDLVM